MGSSSQSQAPAASQMTGHRFFQGAEVAAICASNTLSAHGRHSRVVCHQLGEPLRATAQPHRWSSTDIDEPASCGGETVATRLLQLVLPPVLYCWNRDRALLLDQRRLHKARFHQIVVGRAARAVVAGTDS